MADQNQDKTFEDFEFVFFSFEPVLSSDNNDPDKNLFIAKFSEFILHYFYWKIL